MTSIIGRYVSTMLLTRFLIILLGTVTLLQLFDLLSNSDDIIKRQGAGLVPVLRYLALRLPATVSLAFPFSVLLAAVMTLIGLARNNEIMALKASGLSFYRLLAGLVPLALILAVVDFVISDQLVPPALRVLSEMEVEREPAKPGGAQRAASNPVWIRDGRAVVRVDRVQRDGRLLWNVEVFERDGNGILLSQLLAKRALFRDGIWTLYEVAQVAIADDPQPTERFADLTWPTALLPSNFADLAVPPQQFSARELLIQGAGAGTGSRPTYAYQTWFQKRMTLLVLPLVMVVMAAPVAQGSLRGGGVGWRITVGIGLGFLYFVADGLTMALGETGAVHPILAGWGPVAIFAVIGASLLLRTEQA